MNISESRYYGVLVHEHLREVLLVDGALLHVLQVHRVIAAEREGANLMTKFLLT